MSITDCKKAIVELASSIGHYITKTESDDKKGTFSIPQNLSYSFIVDFTILAFEEADNEGICIVREYTGTNPVIKLFKVFENLYNQHMDNLPKNYTTVANKLFTCETKAKGKFKSIKDTENIEIIVNVVMCGFFIIFALYSKHILPGVDANAKRIYAIISFITDLNCIEQPDNLVELIKPKTAKPKESDDDKAPKKTKAKKEATKKAEEEEEDEEEEKEAPPKKVKATPDKKEEAPKKAKATPMLGDDESDEEEEEKPKFTFPVKTDDDKKLKFTGPDKKKVIVTKRSRK